MWLVTVKKRCGAVTSGVGALSDHCHCWMVVTFLIPFLLLAFLSRFEGVFCAFSNPFLVVFMFPSRSSSVIPDYNQIPVFIFKLTMTVRHDFYRS